MLLRGVFFRNCQGKNEEMKKTSVAVLAAVAGLLVSAASPVMAQDDVNIGITVVPSRSSTALPGQAGYGGPVYNAADVESGPYGEPAYDAPRYGYGGYSGYDGYDNSGYNYNYGYDTPRYNNYYRPPANVGSRYSYYNRPTYVASPQRYYYSGRHSSSCYWQRQRAYDGYNWTSRPVRVCD